MAGIPFTFALVFSCLILCCITTLALSARITTDPYIRTDCNKGKTTVGSVIKDSDDNWQFTTGRADRAAAWGSYKDPKHTKNNFGRLHITTSDDFSDKDQVYAAGWLEGFMTARDIRDNWLNMAFYFPKVMNASLEAPLHWIKKQDQWVKKQCSRRSTHEEVHILLNNNNNNTFSSPPTPLPSASSSSSYTNTTATTSRGGATEESFWIGVCHTIHQGEGVVDGYMAAVSQDPSLPNDMKEDDFLLLTGNADLYDVIDWMQPDQRPSWSPAIVINDTTGDTTTTTTTNNNMDMEKEGEKLFERIALDGHCSAFVRWSADGKELLFGHSTWDTYTAALRIYKHYNFQLSNEAIASFKLSFSSYPGQLFSDDDFFLVGSGGGGVGGGGGSSTDLVILQTTNKVFDDGLYDKYLTTKSVLSWQRVRAAHWMATNGEEWSDYVAMYNSGTYNNQYIVLDMKLFTPGSKELAPGTMWVVEQIPGLVERQDLTDVLADQGYFASYNVPYFPNVYKKSGYPDYKSKLEKFGQHFTKTTHWLTHDLAPRAKIFKREAPGIADLGDIKRLMRSNGYGTKDPLSEGHPLAAVCGRGDLAPIAPVAKGCYDSKVSTYSLASGGRMESEAVNGPTRGDGESLPAFEWRKFPDIVHHGHPEKFDFLFERMSPVVDDDDEGCVGGLYVQ